MHRVNCRWTTRVGVALVALVAATAPGTTVRAATAPAAGYGVTAPPRTVTPTAAAVTPRTTPIPPRRLRAGIKPPTAPAPPGASSTRGPAASTPASKLEVLTTFPAISEASEVADFGSDHAVAPPDTQVAAGPNDVLELVNDIGTVFSKAGSPRASVALADLFGISPGEEFTDPRVLYDPSTGRWFASGAGFVPNSTFVQGGSTYVALSRTSDPAGAWESYQVTTNGEGILFDQPRLGVTSDKVVLSWDDYRSSGPVKEDTWVLEKADMLAAAPAHLFSFGPTAARANVAPVAWSPAATAHLVYNAFDPITGETLGFIGFVTVTGTPAQANVTRAEVHVTIRTTSIPPDAQPLGPTKLSTGDDRVLGAVEQGARIWLSATTGCMPPGDTATRACLRLVQLSTDTQPPTVSRDLDVGRDCTGDLTQCGDLFYPAVAFDRAGNLVTVFSQSTPSTFAGVAATGQLTSQAAGTVQPPVALQSGQGAYIDGSGNPSSRWGDYSGAAVDPVDGTDVWVAGEYAASSTDPHDWGTAVSRVTFAAPVITRMTPVGGPTAGGTRVTIDGTDFVPGATTVTFGGTPASATTFVSPDRLVATAPAHATGRVAVTAQTDAGTSAVTGLTQQYTYTDHDLWLSWYDGTHGTPDWLVVANTGGSGVEARVDIGAPEAGAPVDVVHDLTASGAQQEWEPQFPGVIGGPVHVLLTGPGVASIRSLWGSGSSENLEEVNGIPSGALAPTLYWPWYDGVSTGGADWVHVVNPGDQPAHITLKLAGTTQTATLDPGANWHYNSSSLIGGPVEVDSDHPVLASQRVLWGGGNFSETPGTQPSADGWFSWFDAVGTSGRDWIVLANPGAAPLTAHIAIAHPAAGAPVSTDVPVAAGHSEFRQLPGVQGGPVHVTADAPVVASQRAIWSGWSMEEVAATAPAAGGVLGWYDAVSTGGREWLLLANVGGSSTDVTVTIGGSTVYSSPLAPGAVDTPVFGGVAGGPVVVGSSGGSLVVSRRTLWGPGRDFTELVPFSQAV